MKITLTVELDLPDDMAEWPDAELCQVLFESYINYVTCQHIEESMHWTIQSVEDRNAILIAENHKQWYNIAKQAKWSFKRN